VELISIFGFSSYQFNPELYNPDVVVNILIKALTASPFPDFNLCISLLDERTPSTNLDEPDPLPSLLPVLTGLHALLQQCKFPMFWSTYHSDDLETLRDNYTVECVGFEDAIREVAVRAVKAAFTKIGSERLGSYLDLQGWLSSYFCFRWHSNDFWHCQGLNWRRMSRGSGGVWTLQKTSSAFHRTQTTRSNPLLFKKASSYHVRHVP
jgi:hypothetical protein